MLKRGYMIKHEKYDQPLPYASTMKKMEKHVMEMARGVAEKNVGGLATNR
jgi:hypothetical protein